MSSNLDKEPFFYPPPERESDVSLEKKEEKGSRNFHNHLRLSHLRTKELISFVHLILKNHSRPGWQLQIEGGRDRRRVKRVLFEAAGWTVRYLKRRDQKERG